MSQSKAALTGDLIEEYQRGRSAAWFWRQVLVAIAVALANEIRSHKLLALRAILIGEVVLNASWFAAGRISRITKGWYPVYNADLVVWWRLLTLGTLLLSFAAAGWTVARFHRAHYTALVLLYAVFSVFMIVLTGFSLFTMRVAESIGDPSFRQYVAFDLACIFVGPAGVLLGGLVLHRPPKAGQATESGP